ncbi:THUMP-like domain-containing protein [Pedobacter sp.]
MNKNLLKKEVQDYINSNLRADVSKIALSKSPFSEVSSAELANQIAAKKKAEKKLPTWFKRENIVFPSALSVEQTSSEETAAYKQQLVKGNLLVDITAGFGVDSFYFSHIVDEVYSCEINPDLAAISTHNATLLGANNIKIIATDGLQFLQNATLKVGTIYVDPARRSASGKVFKLADCTPNVVEHLDLLLRKADRIIVKTSPLLDLQAGLAELKNVSEIHIVSIKNECKELLWVIDKDYTNKPKIICATLNDSIKQIELPLHDVEIGNYLSNIPATGYLFEPDVALMKSGAFNTIAQQFDLQKLAKQSQLYYAAQPVPTFIGRIFKIETVFAPNELKKSKDLQGNVIVRNFPDSAENLVKKFKIKPHKTTFYLFSQIQQTYIVFKTQIVQYY